MTAAEARERLEVLANGADPDALAEAVALAALLADASKREWFTEQAAEREATDAKLGAYLAAQKADPRWRDATDLLAGYAAHVGEPAPWTLDTFIQHLPRFGWTRRKVGNAYRWAHGEAVRQPEPEAEPEANGEEKQGR